MAGPLHTLGPAPTRARRARDGERVRAGERAHDARRARRGGRRRCAGPAGRPRPRPRPQGSWTLTNPARTIARRVGAVDARTVLCEIGVSQQEVINHALTMVASGASDAVAVVGRRSPRLGPGRRRGVRRGRSATRPRPRTRPPEFVAAVEVAAGIAWPVVQQYALIENALGAAEGCSPAERAAREIAALWARCNEVARTNPDAAFPAPLDADEIARPGPANRPLASPYNLWHSSQWTVDQASALLVCSAGRAAAAGIAPDRWLFPHVALHCSSAVTLTARASSPRLARHGRARDRRCRRAWAGRCAISRWPSCTPASRWPCASSSASSVSTGTPPRP